MHSTLIQMSILMACGAVWRLFKPAGIDANHTRKVLTTLVYYVLLPALVLQVLWQADIGLHSFQYSILGMTSVFIGLIGMWLIGSVFRIQKKQLGTLLLAAAFPNVTYLGLPVLEQVFGSWARSVVIQLDLFATTPVLLTLGVMLARHYGQDTAQKNHTLLANFNAPPFWAAALAVFFNLNGIIAPDWLEGALHALSVCVVPLMLFSLGLALNWQSLTLTNIPYILPVILIKMLLMPLYAYFLAPHLNLSGNHQSAGVLDMAMPSMVLGIVFCDRYKLDTPLYAMAVTVTTILSLITLPLWFAVLTKSNLPYCLMNCTGIIK